MASVGPILMVLGGFALFLAALFVLFSFLAKRKGGRIGDTPHVKTGDIAKQGAALANDKGYMSCEGAVSCPTPLISPVTATECLYYTLEVTASWKAGDNNTSEKIIDEKKAAPFTVDDGSGPVTVDMAKGGDVGKTKSFDKKEGMGLMNIAKSIGNLSPGVLAFGEHGYTVDTNKVRRIKGKNRKLPGDAKYKVVENIVEVSPRAYVNGGWNDETNTLGTPKGITSGSLMFDKGTREDLMGATQKDAESNKKRAIIAGPVGAGMLALGLILSLVFGGEGGDEAPATTDTKEAVEDKAPEKAPDKSPEKAADKAPEKAADKAPSDGGGTPPPSDGGGAEAETEKAASSPPARSGGGGGGGGGGKGRGKGGKGR